ncbi:MAG: T9SS type A sorting domain-containing protein [Flavobacteriales bacterium]|nr:T9SS type A sorting domain-containing protein [Flavobacteriales bacterium]
MKQLLLTFLAICIALVSFSQCSPDSSITSPGIFPDEITNLDEAFVGQAYSTQIDVLTPLDTSVSLSGLNVNVTISNIDLTSITGLPNNFTYACNPPNCSFPGGTYACAEIYSTVNPTQADIGYYPLVMTTSTLAINVPLIGSITQLDTVDYFFIDISNSTATLEHVNMSTFKISDVFPNPVSDVANFQFVIGESQNISFYILDMLGNIVNEKKIHSKYGVNKFDIDISKLPSGIYTYCFKNSNNLISKKLIVSNF